MGVNNIGSRTVDSYGTVKSDAEPVTDESTQLPSAQYNRLADGLVDAETAIGTTVAPAAGSLEARAVDHASRLADAESTIANMQAQLALLDFRLTAPGAQASFRRTTLDPSLDPYLTVIDTGGGTYRIDGVTDTIPQDYKAVSHAPYLIQTPSAGQRPLAGSGLDMVFDGSNAEVLRQESSLLAALLDSGEPHSIYVVADPLAGSGRCWVYAGDPSSSAQYLYFGSGLGSITPAYHQRATGFTECVGTYDGAGTQVLTAVYEGGSNADARVYANGALTGGPTAQTSMTATASRFSLGALDRSNPANYLTGALREVFVCVGAHAPSTVAHLSKRFESAYAL